MLARRGLNNLHHVHHADNGAVALVHDRKVQVLVLMHLLERRRVAFDRVCARVGERRKNRGRGKNKNRDKKAPWTEMCFGKYSKSDDDVAIVIMTTRMNASLGRSHGLSRFVVQWQTSEDELRGVAVTGGS